MILDIHRQWRVQFDPGLLVRAGVVVADTNAGEFIDVEQVAQQTCRDIAAAGDGDDELGAQLCSANLRSDAPSQFIDLMSRD
jgi:hypothetical protein